MPNMFVAMLVVGMLVVGLKVGSATTRDEAIVTVTVSSAEHEAQEGYFSLGDEATLMVKPGSTLHRFLSRHRGREVRLILTEAGRERELSRLSR